MAQQFHCSCTYPVEHWDSIFVLSMHLLYVLYLCVLDLLVS